MADLAVILPTLNEAEALGRLAEQLRRQEGLTLDIILADGGSTDGTLAIAKRLGLTVAQSQPGRGRQMNRGARAANARHLLFLHADSSLGSRRLLGPGLACLRKAEAEAEAEAGAGAACRPVAGHYRLRFETSQPRLKKRLGFFEWKSGLNRPGSWNGDQGLLISRRAFAALGGFSEALPFLEDKAFGERLCQDGRFITLPGRLGTSARRFAAEGFARRVLLNALIMGMHRLRLPRFFQQAPAVYRQQGEAGRLRLAPFFRLAAASLLGDGPVPALRRLHALGRYVAGNAWQLCFFLGGERRLPAYDRFCRPLLMNPVGYGAAALLTVCAFALGWLLAWGADWALRLAPRPR